MKLVNMLDLGSSAARLMGSSPITRTIAIGKPTVSTFPAFPPLHTVHESFPSHGVPSIKLHFHCHKLLQAV